MQYQLYRFLNGDSRIAYDDSGGTGAEATVSGMEKLRKRPKSRSIDFLREAL